MPKKMSKAAKDTLQAIAGEHRHYSVIDYHSCSECHAKHPHEPGKCDICRSMVAKALADYMDNHVCPKPKRSRWGLVAVAGYIVFVIGLTIWVRHEVRQPYLVYINRIDPQSLAWKTKCQRAWTALKHHRNAVGAERAYKILDQQ